MKEAREAHLLNASIKTSADNDMTQATSEDSKVGSVCTSLTQLINHGSERRLYAMHQELNMEDQNIGVLQQKLTGICNGFGTLEQKMHHLSQSGTDQLIRGIYTDATRDDFKVQLPTLTAELDGAQKITEGGVFITVVADFKSLKDVTVWVQANLTPDTPKSEHFIDFDILLSGI